MRSQLPTYARTRSTRAGAPAVSSSPSPPCSSTKRKHVSPIAASLHAIAASNTSSSEAPLSDAVRRAASSACNLREQCTARPPRHAHGSNARACCPPQASAAVRGHTPVAAQLVRHFHRRRAERALGHSPRAHGTLRWAAPQRARVRRSHGAKELRQQQQQKHAESCCCCCCRRLLLLPAHPQPLRDPGVQVPNDPLHNRVVRRGHFNFAGTRVRAPPQSNRHAPSPISHYNTLTTNHQCHRDVVCKNHASIKTCTRTSAGASVPESRGCAL